MQWLTVLPVAPETVELNSRVRTTILRMKMACELVYDSFKKKKPCLLCQLQQPGAPVSLFLRNFPVQIIKGVLQESQSPPKATGDSGEGERPRGQVRPGPVGRGAGELGWGFTFNLWREY